MRGETVTQRVGADFAGQSGPPRILPYQDPKHFACQALAPTTDEYPRRIRRSPHQVRPQFCQVSTQGIEGGPAQRHDALFVALAETFAKRRIEMEVFHFQAGYLRDAATGSVEGLQNGPVAEKEAVGRLRCV